jgi:hypothetical protein
MGQDPQTTEEDVSTEVAPPTETSTELAEQEALRADLQRGDLADRPVSLPVIKLAQALTSEVVSGDAKAGEYVHGVTGESLGETVEFIVVRSYEGRFLRVRETGASYSCGDVDTAPDHWPEEYAGKRFADIPDAEENFKRRANAGEIPWGSGPPISTTYNFVGLLTDNPDEPVRVSFMRASVPAARKLESFLRAARAWHDNVYVLGSELKSSSRDEPYYAPTIKRGGRTEPEQRQRAVDLALLTQRLGVEFTGDESTEASAPESAGAQNADGGLDI